MATLLPPGPPQSPSRMPRKLARKCERYCCLGVTYFPLFFVYSITTWAVWVESTIGFLPGSAESIWIGKGTSLLGIALYVLLNWSYTIAVFTSPGTTTSAHNGYSSLPMHATPVATNFTVKSNGELRYCKKCQATKPDRAHHCSTCRTCVLKMDHHCPWLANCVGLRNYKAFLLFLIYTCLFCVLCCAVSVSWVWRELLSDDEFGSSLLPINYVMLAVIAGVIGLVLCGFTGWHILLASRGQTTIECLEKTRYLSPLRKTMQRQIPVHQQRDGERDYEAQSPDTTDAAPQQEVANIPNGQPRHFPTHDALERSRARARYEEYLDEQDSEKLPSAFDLGWRRNLLHLFGPRKALWAFPINTTTGDGWSWEASPKWMEARTRIANEREAQRERERNAGWGEDLPSEVPPPQEGAGRHYVTFSRSPSKADRILGRTPDESFSGSAPTYRDSVSMQNLRPRTAELDEDQYEISSDEDEADRRALDRKATDGWPRRVGVVTNTLLGNTLARQKDDVRGWDGQDDGVD